MAPEASSSVPPPRDSEPKRKLRKGTHSCQECKKRKVRCHFRSIMDAACVACQRRGAECLGQEYLIDREDDMAMAARIVRLETLMGNLIDKIIPDEMDESQSDEFHRDDEFARRSEPLLRSTNPLIVCHPFTHADAEVCNTATGSYNLMQSRHGTPIDPSLSLSIHHGTRPPADQQYIVEDDYSDLRRRLFEAFPSQQDAAFLISATKASIFLQIPGNEYHTFFARDAVPGPDYAALPPASSHPMLLARKLLQLVVCSQHLDYSFPNPIRAMEGTYLELVSQVTGNEKLLDSLEGLECLCLEALVTVMGSNLRKGLFVARRAVTLAQFMGIHKGCPRPLKVLDPSATRATPSGIWTRIVWLERYLSLLLGFPSSIPGDVFAYYPPQAEWLPVEIIDRAHAEIAGKIIARNESGAKEDGHQTESIDYALQEAVTSVPAGWWQAVDLERDNLVEPLDRMEAIIRAQTQITHYNLLTILHLPFMLQRRRRGGDAARSAYSRSTVVHASREVLARWIKFRRVQRVAFCCRWVDFCAYTAAMALLLSHLEDHQRRRFGGGSGGSGGGCGIDVAQQQEAPPWQRLRDRTLVESAMDVMEELNRANNDALSLHTAHVTRKLLALEDDAASGDSVYSAENVDAADDGSGHESQFCINIPYLGAVMVTRRPPPPPPLPPPSSELGIYNNNNTATTTTITADVKFSDANTTGPPANWGRTPAPLPPPPSAYPSDHHGYPNQGEAWSLSLSPFIGYGSGGRQIHRDAGGIEKPPNLFADANDWALQGVDLTIFDNVFSQDPGLADQVAWAGNLPHCS